MDFLNLKKPKNDLSPAVGRLLIAEPFLSDPNFARSVILLCEHGEEGTIGFILNRSTELTLGDLLPGLSTPELSIYQGGPVQMDTLHMIHKKPADLGGNEIFPGIYWGGSYEALQDLVTAEEQDADTLKLFVGYSGWSVGQLEKEMEEGSWIVADLRPQILFETSPENVWKEAIKTLGSEYAYLANMPLNPQLN